MSKSITDPSTLTPKAAVSVKGPLAPSLSLTFAKKVQDTKFSFTVTDQTFRQPSEFQGYVVSASRTDGPVTSTITHDFGKNLPKVRVAGSTKRDGNVYSLDYTHFPTKGGGAGLLEAIAKVGPQHKVTLAHKLETSLSQLTYSLDKGDYAGSAAIDSRGAALLTATRREEGRSYKLGLVVAGPKSTASFEWVSKPYKVVIAAPISSEGLGVATTSLIYERTIQL